MPMSVAAWTKAWVYGLSLTRIAGLNPAARDGYLSVVRVVCVSITGLCEGSKARLAEFHRM